MGHFIIIERLIRNITITYTFNNTILKCIKQKLTEFKGEIDNLTIIDGGFNTHSH